MPFDVSKDVVQLHDVSAQYGGGTITANGTYDLKEQVLTADAQLQQVTQSLPGKQQEQVHINGKLAVLGQAGAGQAYAGTLLPIPWISAGAA